MIVHPDFLDHRKTQKLIKMAGDDPSAPFILLRLWGYCQRQRRSSFETLPDLADICHSTLPSERLLEILIECRWIDKDENGLHVHDWEKCNRILRNSWNNGQKGGHPSKFKPTGHPRDAHRQPTGYDSTDKHKHKVGYPRADAKKEEEQQSPQGNPENIKKFGQLCGELSQKLKEGKIE
jgi:hypothetical protein